MKNHPFFIFSFLLFYFFNQSVRTFGQRNLGVPLCMTAHSQGKTLNLSIILVVGIEPWSL